MQRVTNVSKPSVCAKAVIAGLPAPSCSVVADGELERIYSIVESTAARQAQSEADERQSRREASQKRVAHWPNTIEAQRLKKERVRRERFQEEEERRKVIDAQEAELLAAKQAAAVRKANLLLFEQNDRIKTFSSKLFLATVLEEREKQLSFKEERDAAMRQLEAQAAAQQAEELLRAEEQEKTKIKAIAHRTFELKQSQLQQLADIRTTRIKARDEDRSEGQMIKQRAEDAVREELEAEERRRHQQKMRARDLVSANTSSEKLKEQRRAVEQTEEEKIAEFAKIKEEQMAERKRRIEEKRALKLEKRQVLIDRQAQLLLELQQATEERELKAMRDFDGERRAREEREQAARDKRQAEIDAFRKAQREVTESKKAAAEAEKARMKQVWTVRADRLIDEELDERREARAKAERVQHFHLLQAHEKRMQEVHEHRKAFEEGIHMQNALRDEQQAYEAYVSSVMQDYVSKGRKSELVQLAVRRARSLKTA